MTGRFVAALALALVANGAPVFCAPETAPVTIQSLDGSPLLRRMVNLNPNLKSYKAAIHLDVALKSFLRSIPRSTGTSFSSSRTKKP